MSISGVSGGISELAAAQGMFAVAAQAAAGISAPADGSSAASAGEAVQVALLQKALAYERSLVNVLA
jgi:hypothetical protein